LQTLKAACVIPHRIEFILAALQVQTFRFPDLCYFISELCDPFFDRSLHEVGWQQIFDSARRRLSAQQTCGASPGVTR